MRFWPPSAKCSLAPVERDAVCVVDVLPDRTCAASFSGVALALTLPVLEICAPPGADESSHGRCSRRLLAAALFVCAVDCPDGVTASVPSCAKTLPPGVVPVAGGASVGPGLDAASSTGAGSWPCGCEPSACTIPVSAPAGADVAVAFGEAVVGSASRWLSGPAPAAACAGAACAVELLALAVVSRFTDQAPRAQWQARLRRTVRGSHLRSRRLRRLYRPAIRGPSNLLSSPWHRRSASDPHRGQDRCRKPGWLGRWSLWFLRIGLQSGLLQRPVELRLPKLLGRSPLRGRRRPLTRSAFRAGLPQWRSGPLNLRGRLGSPGRRVAQHPVAP